MIYSSSASFGVIFASIFLGEQITLANVVSIALVMGGIYYLRKKLAEDDTDKEKVPIIPCNYGINAKKITKQNVNINRNYDGKSSSMYTENKAKLAKISKLVCKRKFSKLLLASNTYGG